MQIIGGRRCFETFANYALRNGPVAAGGLLQSLQILKVVSLTLPLKMAENFSMSALKCGGGGGEIAKTPIFLQKITRFFFVWRRRRRSKSAPNHFVPNTQINVNNC